jgi:hypothetical protein
MFPSKGSVKKHIAIRPECKEKWESMVEDTDSEGGLPVDLPFNPSPLRRSRSTSFDPDDNPAASKRRVTVEDVADEDEDNLIVNRRYFEQCPDASWTLREGQTKFEKYQQDKEDEGEDEWAPFCDKYESRSVHCICRTVNICHQGGMGTWGMAYQKPRADSYRRVPEVTNSKLVGDH